MTRATPTLIAAILLCQLALEPSSAEAQSGDLARSHFVVGQSYYQRGNYEAAIREFRRAHKLSGKAALLYNIAQAYERLGRVKLAVSHYRKYLSASGAKNPQLQAKIRNLERRVVKTAIEVVGGVAGAILSVDGRSVGALPLSKAVVVSSGTHRVEVKKEGYASFSATVFVPSGSVVTVRPMLSSLSAPANDRDPAGKAAASTAESRRASAPAVALPSQRKRFWTWIAFGSAAALSAGAVATGIAALGKADSAPTSDGADAGTARTLGVVTDVFVGVAVAAAVTAAVLFFTEGKASAERGQSLVVAPTIGRSSAGVQARLQF